MKTSELQDLINWYFECADVSLWFFGRDDIDCIDDHNEDEYCPWCTPYDEIDVELRCVEAKLREMGK